MPEPIAPAQPTSTPPAEPSKPTVPPAEPAKGGDTPPANEGDKTVPYSRFNEVNERAKLAEQKLAEKEKAESEAATKRLEDEGKWKELAEKSKTEAETARQQVQEVKIENRVIAEASKLNIVDVDAALKLLDRSSVKVDKEGKVTGVEDALKALVEDKPYLVNSKTQTSIGSPTNPGAPGNEGVKKFKLSQIQDREFYKANEKDIDKALKLGLVEDDLK